MSDKVIRVVITLNCSPDDAFDRFIKNRHLEEWLTVKADVNEMIGGKYELFWDPESPKHNSTKGCSVLSLERPYHINFEWKGPVEYEDFMNEIRPLTNVTVMFHTIGDKTQVTLLHTGWRKSDDWDRARFYFEKAWTGALHKLEESVNK